MDILEENSVNIDFGGTIVTVINKKDFAKIGRALEEKVEAIKSKYLIDASLIEDTTDLVFVAWLNGVIDRCKSENVFIRKEDERLMRSYYYRRSTMDEAATYYVSQNKNVI